MRVDDPANKKLPFGTTLTTRYDFDEFNKLFKISWESVLGELYSNRTETAEQKKTAERAMRPGEAFAVRHDNRAKPQYYLQTVAERATLYHIQPKGDFWGDLWESPCPRDGEMCYTNGFVWTSPNPTWTWETKGTLVSRVRIEIPEKTQVVIDRSPVYWTDCQFEEDRVSLFPDVLLGPAKFRVKSVKRYRSKTHFADQTDTHIFTYLKPNKLRAQEVTSEEEYAGMMLNGPHEFMDVTVEMVEQVKVAEANLALVQYFSQFD